MTSEHEEATRKGPEQDALRPAPAQRSDEERYSCSGPHPPSEGASEPSVLDSEPVLQDTGRDPLGWVSRTRATGGPSVDFRENRYSLDPGDDQLSFFPRDEGPPDPDEQRLNLLALSEIKGMGEASVKALLTRFSDLGAVWDAPPSQIREVLAGAGSKTRRGVVDEIFARRKQLRDAAHNRLRELEERNVRLLVNVDPEYPKRLLDTPDAPRWLFVEGDHSKLSMPNLVAVVGTREPTREGLALTRALTNRLATWGFGIVSGLADGIDQAAHRTAVEYGAPTIGVMGTGILESFPKAVGPLRKRIVDDGGAVVTEYFPNDTYSRSRFVKRNRIQAALSYATVPVEAKAKSGTAHTYRFAKEYERIAFGVERASVPMQNGILELLRLDGSPIFDLDSPEDVRHLEELLVPALSDVPLELRKTRLFDSLMREFRSIVASYPVTADDVVDLKNRMHETWVRVGREKENARRDGRGGNTRS